MTTANPAPRFCVITNPRAGHGDALQEIFETLGARPGSAVRSTESADEARTLAAQAGEAGFDVVVAAGGDGTISQVVEGILSARTPVTLGIVPLGTGNDLARTLGVPLEPAAAMGVLLDGRERLVDLVRARADDGKRAYVANCAAGGFGGEVDRALEGADKSRWGALAYLMGALKVLPDMKPYRVSLRWDDEQIEQLDALNVLIANGQTVAGGWRVCPAADLEDEMLDVIVVKDGSAVELAAFAARLASGTPFESELVLHRRARDVHIVAEPRMWFNTDGELLTDAGIRFTVLPKALRVLVGPGYAR